MTLGMSTPTKGPVQFTLPYVVNQSIRIKAINTIATVRQVSISENSALQFEVTWFGNGTRQSAWVRLDEIEEATDEDIRRSAGFHGGG